MAGEDLQNFKDVSANVLLPREQRAVSLRISLAKKDQVMSDWRNEVFACNMGQSIDRCTITRHLPCILPRSLHLICATGSLVVVDGSLALAAQGIQDRELEAFSLKELPPHRQFNLAGNAFAANVCLTFLIAAMVSSSTICGARNES